MSPRLPLSGVRVADFSWYAAGPYCTLMLGMLGAEVIRLESRTRPDSHRKIHPIYGRDYVAPYDQLLTNRLSAALNLKEPEAHEVARRLVARSDVVVENFRPGVMARYGLGYEDLRRVRPDIIMLSVSAMGQTGPDANQQGYAPIFAALSGLGHVSGFADGPPLEMRNAVDHVCGLAGALAVLAALRHRQRTGEGQAIDLSSCEVASLLMGHVLVEHSLNHRTTPRSGNRVEDAAPHNTYPCAGQDRWVSIAVTGEAEWQGLSRAMGDPEWTRQPAFADLARRKANEDALDQRIAAWTRDLDPYEVTQRCQAEGVAAFPVLSAEDLSHDPHLRARGMVFTMQHLEHGSRVALNSPWRFSAMPVGNRSWSPAVGEHNAYVYGEILGMDPDTIARLEAARILY